MALLACPRCGLSLRKETYEGVEVDMCQECWGFWLDSGELEQIAGSTEYNFSKSERRAFEYMLRSGRSSPQGHQPAPCPRCSRDMEHVRYAESTSIWIDRCSEHGVWLDTAEIKAIQVYMEEQGDAAGDGSLLDALGDAGTE